MPDEPTGGRAPSRRRRSLPPRASALVAIAFTLLAVSCAVYVRSIPSLLPAGDRSAAAAEKDGGSAETGRGQTDSAEDATGQESQDAPTTENDAGTEKSSQPEGVELPSVSLEGAHVGEKPSSPSAENPKADAPAADETPSEGTDGTPGDNAGDNVFTSTPSAEEEAEFHAFLVSKASAIPGYVSRANACASTFESTCQSASLSDRRINRDSCAALEQQLLSEYLAVRDYVRSNNSQYCDEQERLIGAYRCLTSYVGCYLDAWTANVSFEDPGDHVSEFTAPLAACDGYLAEFHSYYDGLAL